MRYGEDMEVMELYYDSINNLFIDADGFIVWDIFRYISPNDLYMFRQKKEFMLVDCPGDPLTSCELYYEC